MSQALFMTIEDALLRSISVVKARAKQIPCSTVLRILTSISDVFKCSERLLLNNSISENVFSSYNLSL
jgi:hypothetical protein